MELGARFVAAECPNLHFRVSEEKLEKKDTNAPRDIEFLYAQTVRGI